MISFDLFLKRHVTQVSNWCNCSLEEDCHFQISTEAPYSAYLGSKTSRSLHTLTSLFIYITQVFSAHQYPKAISLMKPLGVRKASGTHILKMVGMRSLLVPCSISWVNWHLFDDIPQQWLTDWMTKWFIYSLTGMVPDIWRFRKYVLKITSVLSLDSIDILVQIIILVGGGVLYIVGCWTAFLHAS